MIASHPDLRYKLQQKIGQRRHQAQYQHLYDALDGHKARQCVIFQAINDPNTPKKSPTPTFQPPIDLQDVRKELHGRDSTEEDVDEVLRQFTKHLPEGTVRPSIFAPTQADDADFNTLFTNANISAQAEIPPLPHSFFVPIVRVHSQQSAGQTRQNIKNNTPLLIPETFAWDDKDYILTSFAYHYGRGTDSGHYHTVVRTFSTPKDRFWVVDDGLVKEISKEDFLKRAEQATLCNFTESAAVQSLRAEVQI